MYELWGIIRDVLIVVWLYYMTFRLCNIIEGYIKNANRHNGGQLIKQDKELFKSNIIQSKASNTSLDVLAPDVIAPALKSPPKMSGGFGKVEKSNG